MYISCCVFRVRIFWRIMVRHFIFTVLIFFLYYFNYIIILVNYKSEKVRTGPLNSLFRYVKLVCFLIVKLQIFIINYLVLYKNQRWQKIRSIVCHHTIFTYLVVSLKYLPDTSLYQFSDLRSGLTAPSLGPRRE